MELGIVGYGRLGKFLTTFLEQDFSCKVFDTNQKMIPKELSKSLEEVCACPAVILAVPIGAIERVSHEISSKINKDTLVIDVCSVKSKPIQWMKSALPVGTKILGTHPMFGPDSAAKTLYGSKIVLCKENTPEQVYLNIKNYLETHGMKVIEASAEEHDKQISHSLLLTHFIGRGLISFEAEPLEIDTKGFRRLMKILETVENDSFELFEDMNKYNPYAKMVREDFIKSLQDLSDRVTT